MGLKLLSCYELSGFVGLFSIQTNLSYFKTKQNNGCKKWKFIKST